jgi:hypothetical protein
LQAIATAGWDPEKGSLRPVFLHEFVHSFFELSAGLPQEGGWVQEGLASYYQLQFHPQADLAKIVQAGLRDPKSHLPLKDLCSGKRIPTNRYWQAMTVWQFLLSTPKYREKLPHALRERIEHKP